MKLNSILNMVKDTVTETAQKIGEKKTLKIKDIVLIPEFQKLLVMWKQTFWKRCGNP